MPRMQQRRDSAANWASVNPVLAAGEIGVETPSRKFKIGDGTTQWNSLGYSGVAGYRLSATTTNATPTKLTGDSLALENGEAWQFEVKLVAQNKKTSGTKVWSIRGGIKRSFAGAVTIVGSLDTQTTGSIGGGSVSLTADAATQGLAITVTGLATASVDWQATVLTSEKTSTQQPQVGGCTDPDVGNYDSAADYDDGSCSYSAVPSSAALEPVASEDEIETLEVTVGESVLYPAFDLDIHDYCVSTDAAYLGSVSYSVTINDGEPIEGTAKAGRTLQINDGTNYYYVRLLPSDVVVGSVEYGPTEDYVPGYYLAANALFGESGGPYHYVYDHRGVPVWYARTNTFRQVSTHLGRDANRVLLNPANGDPRTAIRMNASSVSRTAFNLLPSPQYGSLTWETHEARDIHAPPSRYGNVLGIAYDSGFYIQEQSPSGELVWEWHSKDYFTAQNHEYYWLNAVDVHPVTGDILISMRNCSAIACIDYATKEVRWVLQGKSVVTIFGTLQDVAIPEKTSGTKWLTISGEPVDPVTGDYQYEGTAAQHDARWASCVQPLTPGNVVISAYDNQSSSTNGWTHSDSGPRARGVVYEINEASGVAIHRDSIFSESGVSPYMGSYCLSCDADEGHSHAIDFVSEHPCLVEYRGSVGGSKTAVFKMDLPGDHYRLIKVPLSQFRQDNLRATCGVNAATGALPSAGGGGGGAGTSLLMHFDIEGGFADASGTSASVTANGGAVISTTQSVFGGASGLFDGVDSWVEVDPSPQMDFTDGDFTIEGWVYQTSSSGYQLVLTQQEPGAAFALQLFLNDGVPSLLIRASNGGGLVQIASVDAISSEEWHHLACVRSSGTLSLCVDGISVASGSVSGSYSSGGSVPVAVAAFYDGSNASNFYSGYIDELRIVKGTAVYTDDFTPPSAPFTS